MDSPLELATILGGYLFVIGGIVAAWTSYHWQAIRSREIKIAAVIQLTLLILFAIIVVAWIVQAVWSS